MSTNNALRLSQIGSLFHKGALVVHENMLKGPKEARVVQVGKVEKVLEDGMLEVNWNKGAARGEYAPRELFIHDPY